jgi:hypothetical protein
MESISKCTPEMWQNFCRHCEELILADLTKHMGNVSYENIPPFIIYLLILLFIYITIIQTFMAK